MLACVPLSHGVPVCLAGSAWGLQTRRCLSRSKHCCWEPGRCWVPRGVWSVWLVNGNQWLRCLGVGMGQQAEGGVQEGGSL